MTKKQKIFDRVIYPKDLISSRRLLSRLIVGYQKGEISGQVLRDLAPYLRLLLEYSEKIEIVNRIEALENIKNNDNDYEVVIK